MNDATPTPTGATEAEQQTGLASAKGIDLDQLGNITTQVQSWQTEGGTRVKFVHAPGLPMLDLVLSFRAGSAMDEQHAGRAALTLYMLEEGVNGLDVSQFAERMESLGANVGKELQLERAIVSVRTLTSKTGLEPVIALFTDLVARPDFPASALDKIKRQLRDHDAADYKRPEVRADSEVYRHLYPGHPYANVVGSTPEGLDALDIEALKAFYQRGYSANNLDLTLVGDVSRHEAEALALRISQALPQSWAAQEPPAAPRRRGTTVHIEQPAAVSSVQLGLPLQLTPDTEHYPALALASEVLGSGLDSRLMNALRQQHGLTYGIQSALDGMKTSGVFNIRWNVAPAQVQASQTLVGEVLRTFIEQGPTEQELQLARQKLAGRLVRGVARNQSLAGLLSLHSHHQLPEDHLQTYLQVIAGISAQQVRTAVQYHFDLSRSVLVSVGPSVTQQPLPPRPAIDQ